MTDSQQLLAEYARTGSEAAFRELVTRYVDLVYSTALRLVGGDTHRAEDVTQTVFMELHRHTCFVAANTMRGERRRQSRERQAVEMNVLQNNSGADFSQVTPMLDEAINELGEADRTAILLRFFEQKDFRAVGQALGSNDDAARMRVTCALVKLEDFLKRRGITTSAASLGVVLSVNAVQAAPAELAITISIAAALAGTTFATTATATVTKAIAMTTLQKTLIVATVAAAVGTGIYEARKRGFGSKQSAALSHKVTVSGGWRTGRFVKIERSAVFEDFLSSVPVQGETNLTKLAKENLGAALNSMFMAFSDGSYDAYLKFRRPIPAEFSSERLAMIRSALARRSGRSTQHRFTTNFTLLDGKTLASGKSPDAGSPTPVPDDPEQLLKLQFERTTHMGGYRGWWQELSTKKAYVNCHKADEPPERLVNQLGDAEAGKGPPPFPIDTLGISEYSSLPIYQFKNSPATITKGGRQLLYVDTCWVVKLRPPDSALPVFARFYWDEDNSCWLPQELLMGSVYRSDELVPIF